MCCPYTSHTFAPKRKHLEGLRSDQDWSNSLATESQHVTGLSEFGIEDDQNDFHHSACEHNDGKFQSISPSFFGIDVNNEESSFGFNTPLGSTPIGHFGITPTTAQSPLITDPLPVSDPANQAPNTSASVSASPSGGPQPKPYSCNRCPKCFKRNCDLRRHYKKHFDSTRTHHCHVNGCHMNGPKGFYRKDKFADHQKKMHGI